jgi:hypothetical protein
MRSFWFSSGMWKVEARVVARSWRVASAGSSMGCARPWWWTVTVNVSAVSAIFVEKGN